MADDSQHLSLTDAPPRPVVRTALIGCGAIAASGHLPALIEHPRFDLVAMCDIDLERARRLASKAAAAGVTCEVVDDYRRLAGRDDIDAFVLALHPQHSVAIACDLLGRGRHVLDEKPLAVTVEDGLRVQAAAEAAKGVYQIGFVFRYCGFVRQVGELIEQLGQPIAVHLGIFDEAIDPADGDHLAMIQTILAVSSAITHEGSHPIDYAQQWGLCDVIEVEAHATLTDGQLRGPNLWTARLDCVDGLSMHLDIGWLLDELPESYLRVSGPRGQLRLTLGGEGELKVDGRTRAVVLPALMQDWRGQLDRFAGRIDGEAGDGATVRDGLRALRITLACEASAWSAKPVRVAVDG